MHVLQYNVLIEYINILTELLLYKVRFILFTVLDYIVLHIAYHYDLYFHIV